MLEDMFAAGKAQEGMGDKQIQHAAGIRDRRKSSG